MNKPCPEVRGSACGYPSHGKTGLHHIAKYLHINMFNVYSPSDALEDQSSFPWYT